MERKNCIYICIYIAINVLWLLFSQQYCACMYHSLSRFSSVSPSPSSLESSFNDYLYRDVILAHAPTVVDVHLTLYETDIFLRACDGNAT